MTVVRGEPGTGMSKLGRAFPMVTVGRAVGRGGGSNACGALHPESLPPARRVRLKVVGDALDRVDELRTRCDHGARRESAAKEVSHRILVVHRRCCGLPGVYRNPRSCAAGLLLRAADIRRVSAARGAGPRRDGQDSERIVGAVVNFSSRLVHSPLFFYSS